MSWTVRLLWPHSSLSPNARVHWAEKSRAAKIARRDAYFCACAGGFRKIAVAGPLAVRIEAHPPVARRRDADNLIASLKPALDGIADAGCVDDSQFRAPAVEFREPVPPAGLILIRIEEAAE